ncbi:MAG: hypothetical protein NTY37_10780 [Methanothrix sp.]|nr:hypothetical protein [Methanothrix sp.]
MAIWTNVGGCDAIGPWKDIQKIVQPYHSKRYGNPRKLECVKVILKNKLLLCIFFIFITSSALSTSEQLAKDENRTACFNKIFSDFGTDTNMNGLYDIITIKLGINVFTSGEYTVSGSLYDISGNEIINTTKKTFIKFGCRFIGLEFYGSKRAGRHYLRNLALYDPDGNLINYIGDAYITKNKYYNLEYGPLTKAKLTGYYNDYGTDANGDGLYDFLTIDTGINVKVPEEYSLMGYIYDLKNREVIWAMDHGNLSKGYHTMHLNFDGRSIKKHGMNGSYYLENVTLISGSSYTGLDICDYLRRAYNTSVFNYSDFRD